MAIDVEEARAIVLAAARPLAAEVVPCADALSRVLTQPVIASRTLPPAACSAMDGFAVRAADLKAARADAPVALAVTMEIAAGAVSETPLAAGCAARIFTGAPLPPAADTVVCQEDVRRSAPAHDAPACIEVPFAPQPGAHVRPVGEDVRAGEAVLAAGARLSPAALGLLAALGRSQVSVHRRPRVALVSGGDELTEPDGAPAPGRSVASNAYALAAQCREAGALPVNLGIARDTPAALGALLAAGLSADVLVSSAGASVGDHDHLRPALEKLGCRLAFWGVRMKPGYPLAFGEVSAPGARAKTLVFGLPGNPVSASVCFEQFVRPALLRMAGRARTCRPLLTAVLTETLRKERGRMHFVRVRLAREGGRVLATSTGNQSSGALAGLARAQGLLLFAAGDTELRAGSEARVQLLDADFLQEPCA